MNVENTTTTTKTKQILKKKEIVQIRNKGSTK